MSVESTSKNQCNSLYPKLKKNCLMLWYTQTMDYYLVIKRNEISSHEKTWRNLKCILLSERSQFEKATYCMSPAI